MKKSLAIASSLVICTLLWLPSPASASNNPRITNDMLIAAHALSLDHTVVTANHREFSRVPGLRVENWLE